MIVELQYKYTDQKNCKFVEGRISIVTAEWCLRHHQDTEHQYCNMVLTTSLVYLIYYSKVFRTASV